LSGSAVNSVSLPPKAEGTRHTVGSRS